MKIAALILASASAVMVKEEGEVDISVHVVTSTFGVEDEWLHIDQVIDHGTDDDHPDGPVGGYCNYVHTNYYNNLIDEDTDEWESSHYHECFDDCLAAGGVVEYLHHDGGTYSNT